MARKQPEKLAERNARAPRARSVFRYALVSTATLLAAVGIIAAFHQTEEFLLNDRRFVLPEPDGYGAECPNIRIHGLQHTQRHRVTSVFAPDYGRSVYLMPIEERRRLLLAVEWVQDAGVRRTWPNRIDVHIVEREPVAFVQVPPARPEDTERFLLIDGEGVILPLPKARFRLPVVTGIRLSQPVERRRDAIRQMQRLLAELGPGLAEHLSEIDVADLSNLKVAEQVEDRVFTLMLGNRNFRNRLESFHRHFPEIRAQLAGASVLDLRIEGRITTMETEIAEAQGPLTAAPSEKGVKDGAENVPGDRN